MNENLTQNKINFRNMAGISTFQFVNIDIQYFSLINLK